jgi:hypothetical protein
MESLAVQFNKEADQLKHQNMQLRVDYLKKNFMIKKMAEIVLKQELLIIQVKSKILKGDLQIAQE